MCRKLDLHKEGSNGRRDGAAHTRSERGRAGPESLADGPAAHLADRDRRRSSGACGRARSAEEWSRVVSRGLGERAAPGEAEAAAGDSHLARWLPMGLSAEGVHAQHRQPHGRGHRSGQGAHPRVPDCHIPQPLLHRHGPVPGMARHHSERIPRSCDEKEIQAWR